MDGPENGKLELAVSELDASGPSDLSLFIEDSSSDDGNGVGRGAVVSGHFCVELADCTVQGHISVFLVHVVVSSSGLIPENDTEGLHVVGLALENLVDGKDLSLGALGLELSSQVVPEFGLCNDVVAGEETDGVNLGVSILLGGQLAAKHEVLPDLHLE